MASRKEEKERAREERLKREQEAAANEKRKRLVGYVVAGVLAGAVVAALAIVLASGGGGDDSKNAPKDLKQAAAAAGCTVHDYPDFGNNHVETPVKYKTNPPTSGDHFPTPAEDAAYVEAPKTEAQVHALEHGRIEIQYAPNAPDKVKDDVMAYYKSLQGKSNSSSITGKDSGGVLLFPNSTQMPFQLAVTAWRHSMTCKTYGDPAKVKNAIEVFKQTYRGNGPESVAF